MAKKAKYERMMEEEKMKDQVLDPLSILLGETTRRRLLYDDGQLKYIY